MRIRIRELAAVRGLTMKQLAERLAISHQTVLYWNQGRSFPRLGMLTVLQRFFRCSLDDLVEES